MKPSKQTPSETGYYWVRYKSGDQRWKYKVVGIATETEFDGQYARVDLFSKTSIYLKNNKIHVRKGLKKGFKIEFYPEKIKWLPHIHKKDLIK